jgi:dihydroflavonol-4-reductase
MKRVFVTGATGFLGASLIPVLLRKGYAVTALVRRPGSLPAGGAEKLARVRGDILDYPSLLAGLEGCSHTIHAAGIVSYRSRDREKLQEVHIRGTENMCRAALQSGVRRFVHVSSTAAVGIGDDPAKPVGENHPFHRRWYRIPYMSTKRQAEEVALNYVSRGLPVVVVNPSTLYGPGDARLHSGEVFRNIAAGRLRMVPPGGNGVVAVEDCAEGVLAAMENGTAGERYILNSENLSFLEIFRVICALLGQEPITRRFPAWTSLPLIAAARTTELVCSALGKPSPIDPGTVAVAWRCRYYDSGKARRELHWTPQITFPEACRRALEYYYQQGLIARRNSSILIGKKS